MQLRHQRTARHELQLICPEQWILVVFSLQRLSPQLPKVSFAELAEEKQATATTKKKPKEEKETAVTAVHRLEKTQAR